MAIEITRRRFIAAAGASAAAASLSRAEGEPPDVNPLPGLQATLAAAGYDPTAGNSALLAVIADPHISTGSAVPLNYYTDKWDDRLINEINTLVPAVSDLVIAGDLIMHHSVVIGGPRYPTHVAWARDEFRLAKIEMARFRPTLSMWAVPGNHDTDASETDAELWREEMQIPPYQKAVLGGVPVFFLNSGNGGMLDARQLAWFRSEASTIPKDQEVLVVVHHPVMLHMWEEAGVKRILATSFAQHQAPIWVIGGHGHYFMDALFTDHGTRFVQMEITTANSKLHNDGNAPGYAILALQGGRVIQRIFRTFKQTGFQVRPAVAAMPSSTIRWPFDEIPYPAEVFQEGFYDRSNRLISFTGVDLGCHFVYCKSLKFRLQLSRYLGKVDSFVFAANVSALPQPVPTCSFSTTGMDGSWVEVPFPAGKGQGLYHVPIPLAVQNSADLFLKIESSLTSYYDGFNHCGFALAANGDRLTGYEKWISWRYRTLVSTPETVPEAITPQSTFSNLANFGFNLPTTNLGPAGTPATSPPVSSITGPPAFSNMPRDVSRFRFARRTADSDPGITYEVEESADLQSWTKVTVERLALTPLEPNWEEVAFIIPNHSGINSFCRVKVAGIDSINGSFNAWAQQVAVAGGTPDDRNSDGISDLLQFAFDLRQDDNSRLYDPNRPTQKAGMPVQTAGVAGLPRIVFPRMRADLNPGVSYSVEKSTDQSVWAPLATGEYSEQVIRRDGEWEEVEVIVFDAAHTLRFYRIHLELQSPLPL